MPRQEIHFEGPNLYQVVIEIDAKAAYAYLIKSDQIVGDVWLFNVGPAPESPPWENTCEPPYANPVGYGLEAQHSWPANDEDFRVLFKQAEPFKCAVYLRSELIAVLWEGARPGKSAFALKPSPVATPLQSPD